jgi:hypothetical protein
MIMYFEGSKTWSKYIDVEWNQNINSSSFQCRAVIIINLWPPLTVDKNSLVLHNIKDVWNKQQLSILGFLIQSIVVTYEQFDSNIRVFYVFLGF